MYVYLCKIIIIKKTIDDTALKLLTVASQGFWQQILEHFKSMSQMLPSFLANEKFDFLPNENFVFLCK